MTVNKPAFQSVRRRIRVRKEDSAFVYCILESYEGLTAYSTLPHHEGDTHRDLDLQVAPDFCQELDGILSRLGEWIHEI